MSTLVILRHGESVWNRLNVFTGWVDVPLSQKGIEEALNAGAMIADVAFDVIFVSTLVRSMETAMLAMAKNKSPRTPVVYHSPDDGKIREWGKIHNPKTEKETIPVFRCEHLNERYYGMLQGNNKKETAEIYGEDQVKLWRRSYDTPPPEGESLKDTAERTIPFFKDIIIPYLEKEQNVLVSAHGNSLRSIVMYLDKLSREQVLELEIPTGVPLTYQYNTGDFAGKE